MQFLEVKNKLSDLVVFTARDIRKINPNFYDSRLTEWQEKDYIRKIIKGYYVFSDIKINELTLFSIANEIYFPSYISLESALRYYNLIPEGVFSVISVSTKKTQKFDTNIGFFQYRQIKEPLYKGYKVVGQGKKKFKIATIEKSIIDYLYLNTSIKIEDDFKGMRFNIDAFQDINENQLNEYARLVDNKAFYKRINNFLKYLNNA